MRSGSRNRARCRKNARNEAALPQETDAIRSLERSSARATFGSKRATPRGSPLDCIDSFLQQQRARRRALPQETKHQAPSTKHQAAIQGSRGNMCIYLTAACLQFLDLRRSRPSCCPRTSGPGGGQGLPLRRAAGAAAAAAVLLLKHLRLGRNAAATRRSGQRPWGSPRTSPSTCTLVVRVLPDALVD